MLYFSKKEYRISVFVYNSDFMVESCFKVYFVKHVIILGVFKVILVKIVRKL